MTSMRRRYVASTSFQRHVPAGNLAPPQYSEPCPPPTPDPILKVTRHLIMLESGLSAFYIQKEWMDSGNLRIYIIVTWTRTSLFLFTLSPFSRSYDVRECRKWLDSTLCPDRTDRFRPNLHIYIFVSGTKKKTLES